MCRNQFLILNSYFLISPLGLPNSSSVIHNPRKDEEQIGQAIHIAHEDRIDRRAERHDAPLRAAAHRSRDVEGGASGRAAGQDEAAQRRHFGVEVIDQVLEAHDMRVVDHGFGDARGELVGGIGELGAQREEVALNRGELGADRRIDP